MNTITLAPEQLRELANAVIAALRRTESEVLLRDEAITLAGFRDASAFHRWAKRNRIKPANRGRYSRSQINLALSREGRARA